MLNIRNRPIVKIGNPTDRVRARERIYKSKRSLKRCQDFSRSPGRIYRPSSAGAYILIRIGIYCISVGPKEN